MATATVVKEMAATAAEGIDKFRRRRCGDDNWLLLRLGRRQRSEIDDDGQQQD